MHRVKDKVIHTTTFKSTGFTTASYSFFWNHPKPVCHIGSCQEAPKPNATKKSVRLHLNHQLEVTSYQTR